MNIEQVWRDFAQRFELSEHQLDQFQRYYDMICHSNELFNLTAITELKPALNYHFGDSLVLGRVIDITTITTLADVGTGAGFPAIPLKIKYPGLKLVLIEVTHKKAHFLRDVCDQLGLDNVEICTYDWRTFLRTTNYQVDLFCARASLQPEELVRMFQPSSPYRHAQLVYWASRDWEPSDKIKPFITQEYGYVAGFKHRRLIVLNNVK